VKLSLPQAPTHFFVRPSFSFPFVKPPNMIPNVDEKILSAELDMKSSTSAPKPEAPWIKRCDFGIKFTDEIQVVDVPQISETEESQAKEDESEEEEEEKGH